MFALTLFGMKTSLAKIVSTAGHPLITIPLFVIAVLFSSYKTKTALFLTFLIVGCIVIPLISWIYLKSKNGSYSNFDVSDKKQRRSLFFFTIPFLVVVTAVLYLTHQPEKICLGLLFATILVIISQLVNYIIKSSMHVSLTLYLAFLAIPISTVFGFFMMFITILIGWSRVVLKRHSTKEVIAGAVIGMTIGTTMLYFLSLNA
jgi:membrane-associated phospholipid phosphatase